jgi:hypothetical protein
LFSLRDVNHTVAPANQTHVTAPTRPAKGAPLRGARRADTLLDLQRLMGNRVVGGVLAPGRPLAGSRFGGLGQPFATVGAPRDGTTIRRRLH